MAPKDTIKDSAQYDRADVVLWEQQLREKEMYLDAGFIGKLFGSGANCTNNIAGLTIIIAFIASVIINGVLVYNNRDAPYEIWKITSPIITAALGFIFGQHVNATKSKTPSKNE